MNGQVLTIDRIVLSDLGVAPERAERIRALVEVELQRLLERKGWPDGLAGGEVRHLDAPEVRLAKPHSDSHLAGNLAQSIARALQGAGSSRGK